MACEGVIMQSVEQACTADKGCGVAAFGLVPAGCVSCIGYAHRLLSPVLGFGAGHRPTMHVRSSVGCSKR
jgi:hypothetical protein